MDVNLATVRGIEVDYVQELEKIRIRYDRFVENYRFPKVDGDFKEKLAEDVDRFVLETTNNEPVTESLKTELSFGIEQIIKKYENEGYIVRKEYFPTVSFHIDLENE
ncbi:hypothetical protein [Paenibacillus sp. 1-18]|uniref:hypothetical protein n=1 Tax=Paenibacillus sp. 1-18 TaxID=1333846 RepID=UPI000470B3C0|nr:hypothetical protein [Paenibacillus sp. 1-18]